MGTVSDDPTGTLWAQWTGDDHALPTRDTLNQLGDRLDEASQPTQDKEGTAKDGVADANDDAAQDKAKADTGDTTDKPTTQDGTQNGKATGDTTGTDGKDDTADKPLEPDATHKGPGDVKVPTGWYLVRDDKGDSHLAGTLPDNAHAPTDIQLGRLTINGTPTQDTNANADANAQAQADTDTAQETQDATQEDTAPHDAGSDPADTSTDDDGAYTPDGSSTEADTGTGLDASDLQDDTATDRTDGADAPARTDDPVEAISTPTASDGAKEQAGTAQKLTIKASDWTTLLGHKFTLWRIGVYDELPDGDFTTTAMHVTPADKQVQSATSRAMGRDPLADGNAVDDLWTQWATGPGVSRDVADKLADLLKDRAPDATIDGAGEAHVPAGWYLVRDSDGTGHLMGTTIDGRSPTDRMLGVLTIEGAGPANLFGLRKAQQPATLAIQPRDGGNGSGIGGTAGGNDGGNQIWRYKDDADGSWGSGTDYQSVARAMRAGGTGIGQGGVGVVRTELANANRRCVDDFHAKYPGQGDGDCRVVAVGWVQTPGLNTYDGTINNASADIWYGNWVSQGVAGGNYNYAGRHPYRVTDQFGGGDTRSVESLKNQWVAYADQHKGPGAYGPSLVIIILHKNQPHTTDLTARTTINPTGNLNQDFPNNRTGGVSDKIFIKPTTGDWAGGDRIRVCSDLYYDGKDGTTNKQTKCLIANHGGTTRQGQEFQINGPTFIPNDLGMRDKKSKTGVWWSGKYWFAVYIDRWDGKGGLLSGNLSFDNHYFNKPNDKGEAFELARVETSVSGDTTTGDGAVHDNVSAYLSHSGKGTPYPWGVSVRSYLYVDIDNKPNENPRFELAVVDPKDHKEGLHWDASDAKGSSTAGKTPGDGTVISPNITPGMLRDRGGLLPTCTAPNSGVYDPNGNGSIRCTLKQWPNGNATYVFRTKVGDNSAYYGGENLYHNSDLTDPEEQWSRDTWGLRTTAPTTPPTAGSNTPIQDQISLKVNDNPMDVYAIHANIAVRLRHSTAGYGGKETPHNTKEGPADKTVNVDWTSGMNDPPANGYYRIADGLPSFTPSYFGWNTWQPGYYWFDAKIIANGSWKQNNTQLQYCTANYNTPECLNHTSPKGGTPLSADVYHLGAHDMAERFRIRTYTLGGTTKANPNGATGGNANTVTDTLTLTTTGNNVDVSKLTTQGVTFTLGYSRNGYGRTEKYSAKKTGKATGRAVTSPSSPPPTCSAATSSGGNPATTGSTCPRPHPRSPPPRECTPTGT